MIEQITHNNKILAIIIRNSFSKEGIEFFTPNDNALQVGYMNRPKEYSIKPHVHYQIPRTINTLQEVLFIKKGEIRVDFYEDNKNYLFSNNLSKYRSYLKEGNLLIFEIDVIRNIQDQRFIIKNIQFFSKIFHQSNKNLNIYITPNNFGVNVILYFLCTHNLNLKLA